MFKKNLSLTAIHWNECILQWRSTLAQIRVFCKKANSAGLRAEKQAVLAGCRKYDHRRDLCRFKSMCPAAIRRGSFPGDIETYTLTAVYAWCRGCSIVAVSGLQSCARWLCLVGERAGKLSAGQGIGPFHANNLPPSIHF